MLILIVWIILTFMLLLEGLLTAWKTRNFLHYFLRNLRQKIPASFPKVALLAPCKGMDPGLKENIDTWLAQDYPDFRIFFIVDSLDDPSCSVIQGIEDAEVLVAGDAQGCGQKVHNLLFAVSRIPEEYEVFAFVDSDCRLKPDWLRSLIGALNDHPREAVTAYRWFPDEPDFAAILRAVWNSSVLTLFSESGNNFAWGGSMAIFRNTFFAVDVPAYWAGSLSDDYGLMRAMRASSRRIHFVPSAIALTSGRISLFEFLRWALRQLFITRVYHPALWKAGVLFHSIWFVWLVMGIIFFPFAAVWFFLVFQMIQAVKAETRLKCIRATFTRVPVGKSIYFWILSPIVALMNFVLFWRSAFMKRVDWRGIKYEVKNAQQLRVIEY